MFFVVSKLFWFLAQPIALATVGNLAGFALLRSRWRHAGQVLIGGVTLFLAAICVLPIGTWLVLPLEERFPAYRDAGEPVDGILVLGGGSDLATSLSRGRIALSDAADRLTTLTALARRHPDAMLLFSGGSGDPLFQGRGEAETVPAFLAEQGVDAGRLVTENRSRNTWENALFSRELMRPGDGRRWLLVTSAFHMPRAIGCFRRAGIPVVPYPVDYRTTGQTRLLSFQPTDNLRLLTEAWREWIGLVAYRLAGHTDALLPGPEARP